MQDAIVGSWAQDSHLSAGILESLRDLNHRFLDLAAARAEWAAGQVAALSPEQRAAAAGCPYDSLNVALSQDPTNVTKGSNPNTGKVFWNTSTASAYCDGGAAGSGTFRLDSPGTLPADQCWTVGNTPGTPPYYVPAVQFNEE